LRLVYESKVFHRAMGYLPDGDARVIAGAPNCLER
jgi:hypothetical protein